MEVLLVIGIVGLLSFVVVNAINPREHLSRAHDTKRQSDVLAIVNAVSQYLIENGKLPITLPATYSPICQSTAPGCADGLDLSFLAPRYLADIPNDPLAEGDVTGYLIGKDWKGRTVIVAPLSEKTLNIMAVN